MMVESTFAQSISKPSIPEFTVQLTDRSYDEPPTYQTDPYTGKTMLISAGGHVDNKTFDFTIKNQPFTPYKDADQVVRLFYEIRHKGYFEEWSDTSTVDRAYSSDSEYTFVSFIVGTYAGWYIPTNGTVDIQVKAVFGYYSVVFDPHLAGIWWNVTTIGESDWSNTQTITIPDTSASTSTSAPSPTSSNPTTAPTSSPTTTNSNSNTISLPLSTLIGVVAIFLAIIVVLSVLLFRRYRKTFSQNKPNV